MMTREAWLWPGVILFSALAAGLVTFMVNWPPLRVPLSLWFVGVCPGMAYVRLLKLNERLTEWVLAVALSLSLAAIVSVSMLYAGRWSPERGLTILVILAIVGAVLQLWASYRTRSNRVGVSLRPLAGEFIEAPGKVARDLLALLRSRSDLVEDAALFVILFSISFIAFISSLALIGLLVFYSLLIVSRIL